MVPVWPLRMILCRRLRQSCRGRRAARSAGTGTASPTPTTTPGCAIRTILTCAVTWPRSGPGTTRTRPGGPGWRRTWSARPPPVHRRRPTRSSGPRPADRIASVRPQGQRTRSSSGCARGRRTRCCWTPSRSPRRPGSRTSATGWSARTAGCWPGRRTPPGRRTTGCGCGTRPPARTCRRPSSAPARAWPGEPARTGCCTWCRTSCTGRGRCGSTRSAPRPATTCWSWLSRTPGSSWSCAPPAAVSWPWSRPSRGTPPRSR